MSLRSISCLAGALLCGLAWTPAVAQTVYKCGHRTYSQKPCSPGRVVNTDEAPVPARRGDVRRLEQNRVLAQNLRRLPGESTAEFEKRRRRTRLLDTDREECARLDTRMPVEQARMGNPDPDEVAEATAALQGAKKRFRELKC